MARANVGEAPPYGFIDNPAMNATTASSPQDDNTKSVNAMINQQYNDDFMHITLRVPGLKTKRQFNLSKVPKNMRVAQVEYKKNFVSIRLAVNEGRNDAITYKYANSDPFAGPVEEQKSHFKYDENIVHWYVRKAHKW